MAHDVDPRMQRLIPRAYFLCSGKSQPIYEIVIDILLERAVFIGEAPQWTESMADHESGLKAALAAKFPAPFRIRGCLSHQCQNVYRRVTSTMMVRYHLINLTLTSRKHTPTQTRMSES